MRITTLRVRMASLRDSWGASGWEVRDGKVKGVEATLG